MSKFYSNPSSASSKGRGIQEHLEPPPIPQEAQLKDEIETQSLHNDKRLSGLPGNSAPNSRPVSRQSRMSKNLIDSQTRQSRRLTMANFDEKARNRTMAKYLYRQVNANGWMDINSPPRPLGVLLRGSTGAYVTEPQEMPSLLVQAVEKLRLTVAVTLSTDTTEEIFRVLKPNDDDIMLGDGSQVQVVNSLSEIVRAGLSEVRKYQYGALLRQERILLVWHDDLERILLHAANLEEKLLGLIWRNNASSFAFATKTHTPGATSAAQSILDFDTPGGEKYSKGPEVTEVEIEDMEDPGLKESLSRPVMLTGAIIIGFSVLFLIVLVFGLNTSRLVFEAFTDGDMMRFIFIAFEPLLATIAMFFALCLMTDIFQLFGPITGLRTNSRFFSAFKPNLSHAYALGFTPPRMTIQMAVYKESLELVIKPTCRSLKAAVSHYESRGGTANIFICDDGLAYLMANDPAGAKARIDFYNSNNIGWICRPMHGENGYQRTGRFKKASNSNFSLNLSNKVERTLQKYIEERTTTEKGETIYLDALEEEILYQKALAECLAADSRAKANGNIRLGEHILMVDSDTRVPEDCLLFAAAEMFLSPEVAVIQHYTSVVQVAGDFFENGASFFAKMCYSQIKFTVSNGECSPFVGHNAFMRWAAVQEVGYDTGDPDAVMYWSENHISEDFDMAIRLQSAGNVTRYASYHKDEFKEGVSLTIYDEISRWERYSYGDSEMIFNPFYKWIYKGPFAPAFRKFLWCDMHLSSKLSILAYMTSYYAIGSSFFFTIANYVLVGLFQDSLDKFYLQSWNIFLSVVLVFWILGNVSLATYRYRSGEKPLWDSLLENFKWQPMYCFFFNGISFHVNKALLAHIFGYNMTWGATAKEVEVSNFFKEIPKIAKKFAVMYAVMLPLAGGMIYAAFFAPLAWRITETIAVAPLALMIICHCLLPFVLNPSIMVFNY